MSIAELLDSRSAQIAPKNAHRVGRLGPAYWPDGDGPTVIDLFAGGGGMSLGFCSAGYRVVAAVDKDPVAALVYQTNAPEVAFVGPTRVQPARGDITQVTGAELLALAGIEAGTLGLLVGGPPCQGYSDIGRRRPEDARNVLYREFVRLLEELRPEAYLFENVPGLTNMLDAEGNKVIDTLMAAFQEAGYTAKRHIIDAVNLGLPQFRKRLFIVGTRDGRSITLPSCSVKRDAYVTVADAIGDLPVSLDGATAQCHGLPYLREPDNRYAQLMRGEAALALNSAPTRHTPELRQRFYTVPPGGKDIPTRHRRLVPNRPAWTLRAGTRTRTACRPIHPTEQRVITVREAARLGSFPDDFWLPDGKAPAHMIIGNSVPPLVAYFLAVTIAKEVFSDRIRGLT